MVVALLKELHKFLFRQIKTNLNMTNKQINK